ncbi:MaoC family dehydratase N-terminal domain-containing protein [Novosphingobium sp. Gsoil 351]|uniref:FAS1-like dehydratase domain-containing protein n=1 Tax=Novosphingobium sp. Gsoil 351 TaxID=2675225 RepID=UPI0012B441D2|nr:MaoC family dehydratase N-terminal domain-containing protein [Novosphingobium sp. Gsoil 351]QGN54215.1 acyl dehydratase [Novosphingobium sp. Gsoil 351]
MTEAFSISDEFEKARVWKLTDEDIASAQKTVGYDVAETRNLFIEQATENNIRNYAHGIGDDNPLFTDPAYAEKTRWGGVIAPPSMAEVITKAMYGDKLPQEMKEIASGLFRGIHMFVSGSEKVYYEPIFPGDSLHAFSGDESFVEKLSEFSGRTVTKFKRRVKLNQRGEIVFNQRTRSIYAERSSAVKKGKYMAIEPATYSDADLQRIDDLYAAEQRRGAEPRYFEDVSVGEELPAMVKGPLLVTHLIAYHAGGFGIREYGLFGSRLWHQNRKRIPPFYIKNEQGIPDVAQRLHWDNAWAQGIGNPMAYDYGVVRESWLNHYLTDWCGDDGWVFRQYDSMRKFNYIGDTQFLSGRVLAKRVDDGRFLVDLELAMTNQRGEHTVEGEATILLPSREHGPVIKPRADLELSAKAQRMFERHNQLKP